MIALGGAEGVWNELSEALKLCPNADVGGVNEAARDHEGHLSVWATLHPSKFADWQRQRERKVLNTDYIACAHKDDPEARLDLVTNEVWSGTSGLYLCQVALLKLGYSQVIVCGMPLEDSPHYFDSEQWWAAPNYRRGWKKAVGGELSGKIRSMSGWTRELVGPPDSGWLSETA